MRKNIPKNIILLSKAYKHVYNGALSLSCAENYINRNIDIKQLTLNDCGVLHEL
jgi:hypothetical protein